MAGAVFATGLRTDVAPRFPDGSTGELELIRHRGASAVLPFVDPPWAEDPEVLRELITASVGLKAACVSGDPREQGTKGGRVLLNLGSGGSRLRSWSACRRRG